MAFRKLFSKKVKKTAPHVREYKFSNVSCMLSREERAIGSKDDYMVAVIRLFDVNNPHKTMEMPSHVLKFRNIEKIRIRNLNVSYYLEGSDIIINDVSEFWILVDDVKHKITLRAYQKAVEERPDYRPLH